LNKDDPDDRRPQAATGDT